MNWDPQWGVLLQGLGGSLVGLLGVFLAFWLTTRSDREKDRQRREQEAADTAEQRRAAAVRRVHTALVMQPRDTLWAPFMNNAASVELMAAVIDFVQQLGDKHPAVALWLSEQHSCMVDLRQEYRRWCLVPLVRRRKARAWGNQIGVMAGALANWSHGTVDDSWFEERLKPSAVQAA